VTLLEAIAEFGFDAAIGGARRDEEKARAKERVFSFRDEFGQWDPRNQRPELWDLYNARVHKGEHVRVFPISNWTELDVWQYIEREKLAGAFHLLRAQRRVVRRNGYLFTAEAGRRRARNVRCAFAPWATSAAPARWNRLLSTLVHHRKRSSRVTDAAPPAWTTRPRSLHGAAQEGRYF
jgi:hypothetical protein